MKKHDSIMKRVHFIEDKYGIKYAKTDGRLYKTLKIIYTVIFAYTLGINLIFLAGELLMYAGTDKFQYVVNSVITISACTVLLIAGFVLICTRLKLIGAIISAAPLVFSVITFAHFLEDDLGYFGYKPSFYWRHFAPCAIMLLLLIFMTVIAVRARIKTDSQYKKIVANLYEQYHIGISPDGDTAGVTDEQWDEFLKNYDPRDYKKQFASDKSTLTEDKENETADE